MINLITRTKVYYKKGPSFKGVLIVLDKPIPIKGICSFIAKLDFEFMCVSIKLLIMVCVIKNVFLILFKI